VFVDGSKILEYTTTADKVLPTSGSGTFYLGTVGSENYGMDGTISHLNVYSGTMEDADITTIEAALA